jgi:NADH-quinone oxidoreductase subunit K
MTSIQAYGAVAMVIFCIGFLGVVSRKNIFVIYLSIELMLNAINLLLVALSRYHLTVDAQVMALLIIAVAAAEAAVFLSLIVALYRNRGTLNADRFTVIRPKGM